ncbi:ribonuclease T2-like [Aspergillus hancockii]|nr:ribonuclease T2-like [Aspergillus hancockii]
MLQGIPGTQQVLTALTGSLGLSSLLGLEVGSSQNTLQHCPKAELSCQTPYNGQDKCCFNYPGGQMLQTQFWDADPAIGPAHSWTIHGLWPDHCNGGFDQFCDKSRRYSNISLILTDSGRGDLLDEMRTFWKDYKGDDPTLWEHEWNKHGTCISTIEPHCYEDYYPQQDVVDYFDKTVELFHQLPTHEILSSAGIVPSYTETYSLDEIQDALTKAHGADVIARCHYHNFNEVWYFFNVAGPLQIGKFVPTGPDGQTSNCPSKGIRYQPKTPPPTKTRGPSEPTKTGTPSTNRGNLIVQTKGQRRGCIISHGTWFTSGTCATFRAEKASDKTFTLRSSKGECSFEKDAFSCGPQITNPVEFSIQDGELSYRGNTTFFADKAPKGRVQSQIFASEENHPIELTITWKESH